MILEQMGGETVRGSVSSHTSSQGSGQDDFDALGYVFMWGQGIGDGFLGGGSFKLGSSKGRNLDSLYPKAVGSHVVLDAQQIACGGRHAALVTRQGEVFSWGEESGGWLGHGVSLDTPYPKLVEALASYSIEFVACGEYHTCALTQSGDLYSWGDGAHKFSLLGHGRDISQSTPKRISGGIEGLRVSSVTCGPWHTALVTVSGQLFTFGDGTFGVLGHGNRTSISTPKEVESLKGLRTVKAACGVWHTAAVVEIMVNLSSSNNFASGKIFTWGDGDKGRLGHHDKEKKLVPTCVSALIDYDFRQVACGHSLTVALTTSGRVFTLGSAVYGQLGEPRADGRNPVCVKGKLWDAVVEEIACGAHHVAVLTTKSEVYTWGKGANGRLGHGDVEDKRSPELVAALKDRQVQSIACGLSFTAAICQHKWGAGSEQPSCANCRQPFSFTRKRHKCYNCGIIVCHSCSSRKSYKALMAPNPHKPYRVCDSCYLKISQMPSQMHPLNKIAKKQHQAAPQDRSQTNMKMVLSQTQPRARRKTDSSLSRVAPASFGLLRWVPTGVILPSETTDLIIQASVLHSRINSPRPSSQSVSPLLTRTSPMRSTTPTPTLRGLTSPRTILEDVKRANEALSQEVRKLQIQLEYMNQQHDLRESELQKKLDNALSSLAEESEKCRAAKEVIKSLTGQLKELAERFPEVQQTITQSQADLLLPEISGLTAGGDVVTMPGRENKLTHEGEIAAGRQGYAVDQRVEHNVVTVPTNSGTRRGLMQEEDGIEGSRTSEWMVEEDESGVYITFVPLPDGGRDLKRVRFSRRRFTERQAELWWAENRARVFDKYNVRGTETPIFEPKAGKT